VQLGDYATVGKNLISLVDADSFWVDGYRPTRQRSN
jgi:multidrug resistance efflux pump